MFADAVEAVKTLATTESSVPVNSAPPSESSVPVNAASVLVNSAPGKSQTLSAADVEAIVERAVKAAVISGDGRAAKENAGYG